MNNPNLVNIFGATVNTCFSSSYIGLPLLFFTARYIPSPLNEASNFVDIAFICYCFCEACLSGSSIISTYLFYTRASVTNLMIALYVIIIAISDG
jgi:hypothetical protein